MSSFIDAFYHLLWSPPLLIFLLLSGLILHLALHFLPLRCFFYAVKKLFSDPPPAEEGALPPFQAAAAALASTVGTGNIAGTAGAIALGGPGAVFWMWVSALLSTALKFAEVTLSFHYRRKNTAGEWCGGPMYYMETLPGKAGLVLPKLFAFSGLVSSFGIGNLVQVNTMTDSFAFCFPASLAIPVRLAACLLILLLSAFVIRGGMRRLGEITARLVPVMSFLYITGALLVILDHSSALLPAFQSILIGAFRPQSFAGAAGGLTLRRTLRSGMERGVFSNEAGMGSSPLAHASSGASHPVDEGYLGVFEVFADTLIICSLTAFVILTSGIPIPWGTDAGITLTASALSSTFGFFPASLLLTICILCFALSSLFSWSFYGSRFAAYLWGPEILPYYQVLFLLLILPGSFLPSGNLWKIAGIFNAFMLLGNLPALLKLTPVLKELCRDWLARNTFSP